MEPHGPSQTTGESVNGNHTRESNFIKAEDLLADPAIPPLGTYCRGQPCTGALREVDKNVTEPGSLQSQMRSHPNAHQH